MQVEVLVEVAVLSVVLLEVSEAALEVASAEEVSVEVELQVAGRKLTL
jgi:hypothetical protein